MEKMAKGLVILLIVLVLAVPILGRQLLHQPGVVDLHARMPENGGWSQEAIRGQVNVPMVIRLTSDDVVHGFAVGKKYLPDVEVFPGKYSQTELVFDQPGEYTFYCTRWCGANHWRMRGKIIIDGPAPGPRPTLKPPDFITLNLDLDVPHLAQILPSVKPSAEWPVAVDAKDFAQLAGETVWITSLEQQWKDLRADPRTASLEDREIWNMVAWATTQQGNSDWQAQARDLYRQNCLACHGESGRGDGVMMRDLPPMNHDHMGGEATRPPDFSDPAVILGASPALLEGKIIRGGMGTGMPNWGDILTREQIRSLVLYIVSFQMDMVDKP